MTDGAEVLHGTTPGLAAFKFRKKDSDKDVLPDDLEKLIGTDPEASDTDHDGVADSLELSLGFDPLKWDTDVTGSVMGLSGRHQQGLEPRRRLTTTRHRRHTTHHDHSSPSRVLIMKRGD